MECFPKRKNTIAILSVFVSSDCLTTAFGTEYIL